MTQLAWLAVVIAPVSIGAAVFLWRLYTDDRSSGTEGIGLALVLALTGSVGALAAAYLAFVAMVTLLERTDIARSLGTVTIAVLLLLDALPIVNAVYLRWLRGRS